jgi:hypothetical protein
LALTLREHAADFLGFFEDGRPGIGVVAGSGSAAVDVPIESSRLTDRRGALDGC